MWCTISCWKAAPLFPDMEASAAVMQHLSTVPSESHHFVAFKTCVGGYALFCVKHHQPLPKSEPGRSPGTCPGLFTNLPRDKSLSGTLWLLPLCCYGPGLLELGQSSPAGWHHGVSTEDSHHDKCGGRESTHSIKKTKQKKPNDFCSLSVEKAAQQLMM